MKIDDGAKCRKGTLHKFEESRNLHDAIIEACVLCSEKRIYNKGKDGRIDNTAYLRHHLRSSIQPFGRTHKLFEKVYGIDKAKKEYEFHRNKKSKEKDREEWENTRKDIQRKLKREFI